MAKVATDVVSGDPVASFRFMLEVSGKISGFFTEANGLGSETEVIEHKVMGPDATEVIRKLAGRLKWNDMTLKRGITKNMDLWDWRKTVENGNVDAARADGSVMLLDDAGGEIARWNFERAWPSKISGPNIKADDNSVAVEEVTIVFEYIERVK